MAPQWRTKASPIFSTSLSSRSMRLFAGSLEPVAFAWSIPQLSDLAFEIGLNRRFLNAAPILLDPAVQRRETDPKGGRYLLTRQAARQRYTNCFGAEFFGRS